MAEISVWIPWITEAKNSGNITAQEVEPDVWRAITEVVTVDEKVGNDEVKDTRGGNELSKLFLVCRVEQRKEETKEWSKNIPYKYSKNIPYKYSLQIINFYVVTEEKLETNMH